MAAYIIKKKYKESKENITEETGHIISAAANLIKAQIRERNYSNEIYHTLDDILKSGWVLPSLLLFLKLIINSQLRLESIGQCMVKAVKPRIAIPLTLFGFGISFDVFRSKWLVNKLFCLGSSISYKETIQNKQAVVASKIAEDRYHCKYYTKTVPLKL